MPRCQNIFELSYYLGNVLSSISDKLMAKDWNNDQTVDSYKAEILFSQDYTPFGVKMDGMTFTNSYRYGFNGQEVDNDISGFDHYYNFEYRIEECRPSIFLSVDPITDKYPWDSTYCFSENSPIDGGDSEGLEWECKTKKSGKEVYTIKVNVVNNSDKSNLIARFMAWSIRRTFKHAGASSVANAKVRVKYQFVKNPDLKKNSDGSNNDFYLEFVKIIDLNGKSCDKYGLGETDQIGNTGMNKIQERI